MAETGDNASLAASASRINTSNSRVPVDSKPQDALVEASRSPNYGTVDEPLLGDSRPDALRDAHGEDEIENPDRPRGVRFAILFLCILLGDFFTGYVSPSRFNYAQWQRINNHIGHKLCGYVDASDYRRV